MSIAAASAENSMKLLEIKTNYDDKSIIDLVNLYLSNKDYLHTIVNVSKINNIIKC